MLPISCLHYRGGLGFLRGRMRRSIVGFACLMWVRSHKLRYTLEVALQPSSGNTSCLVALRSAAAEDHKRQGLPHGGDLCGPSWACQLLSGPLTKPVCSLTATTPHLAQSNGDVLVIMNSVRVVHMPVRTNNLAYFAMTGSQFSGRENWPAARVFARYGFTSCGL